MKKLLPGGLICFAVLVLAASRLTASSHSSHGALVFVHGTDQCYMLDGNSQTYVPGVATHAVLNPSGFSQLVCKANHVPNDTGDSVHFTGATTGLDCEVYDFPDGSVTAFTYDWNETVSLSGKGSLTCRFRAQ